MRLGEWAKETGLFYEETHLFNAGGKEHDVTGLAPQFGDLRIRRGKEDAMQNAYLQRRVRGCRGRDVDMSYERASWQRTWRD